MSKRARSVSPVGQSRSSSSSSNSSSSSSSSISSSSSSTNSSSSSSSSGSSLNDSGIIAGFKEVSEENTNAFYKGNDAFVDYVPWSRSELVSVTTLRCSEVLSCLNKKVPVIDDPLLIKKLFASQIDAVAAIMAAHAKFISIRELNDRRAGFFLGDGTGAGKTMTAAGVIYLNSILENDWDQAHRNVSIFITKNAPLCKNVAKEINDLSKTIRPVFVNSTPGNKVKSSVEKKKPVCFIMSYNTLVSPLGLAFIELKKNLGEKFSGVVILDESHSINNEKRATAQRISELDDFFPFCRIVYMSATAASSPDHLHYMTRLGLWGKGSNLATFSHLREELKSRHIMGMESIFMQLKLQGSFLARQLCFKGVKNLDLDVILSEEERKVYNTCCAIWVECRHLMALFLKEIITDKETSKRAVSLFYRTQQSFFQLLMTGFKTNSAVELARRLYQLGNSIVFNVQSTGEAETGRLKEEDKLKPGSLKSNLDAHGFISLAKGSWLHFMRESFSDKYLVDNSSVTLDIKSKRDAILKKISLLVLPPNPLQVIMEEFGMEKVADITGRTCHLYKGKIENFASKHLETEVLVFQAGTKRIAILSDAGGTGISLHNMLSENVQRVHIFLEFPWSPEKIIQSMGRTHRMRQKSLPLYYFVKTDVPGEQRFLSSLSVRLKLLGATLGNRDSTKHLNMEQYDILGETGLEAVKKVLNSVTFIDEDPFIPESYSEEDTIKLFDEATTAFTRVDLIGLAGHVEAEKPKYVVKPVKCERFLNRTMAIKLDVQQNIMKYFLDTLKWCKDNARKRGVFDDGVLVIPISKVEKHEEANFESKDSNLKVIVHDVLENLTLEWSQVKEIEKNYLSSEADLVGRFYWNVCLRKPLGLVYGVPPSDPKCSTFSRSYSPIYGKGRREQSQFRAANITTAEALKLWAQAVQESTKYCTHKIRGLACKDSNCQERMYHQKKTILSGDFFSVYEPTNIIKVVKFCFEGKDFTGVEINEMEMERVLKVLEQDFE